MPEGEPGALDPERQAALEEIDPWWWPAWPITWQRSYAVARQWWLECDGRVDWTALPGDTVYEDEIAPLVPQRVATCHGLPDQLSLQAVTDLVEAGRLAPVIDHVYPLDALPEALRRLEGHHSAARSSSRSTQRKPPEAAAPRNSAHGTADQSVRCGSTGRAAPGTPRTRS